MTPKNTIYIHVIDVALGKCIISISLNANQQLTHVATDSYVYLAISYIITLPIALLALKGLSLLAYC